MITTEVFCNPAEQEFGYKSKRKGGKWEMRKKTNKRMAKVALVTMMVVLVLPILSAVLEYRAEGAENLQMRFDKQHALIVTRQIPVMKIPGIPKAINAPRTAYDLYTGQTKGSVPIIGNEKWRDIFSLPWIKRQASSQGVMVAYHGRNQWSTIPVILRGKKMNAYVESVIYLWIPLLLVIGFVRWSMRRSPTDVIVPFLLFLYIFGGITGTIACNDNLYHFKFLFYEVFYLLAIEAIGFLVAYSIQKWAPQQAKAESG